MAVVYVEFRRFPLTRDITLGLGWLIEPIIRNAPAILDQYAYGNPPGASVKVDAL